MKYRCSHCSHIFELADREFHRCPNCFWTTALAPVGSGSGEASPAKAPPAQKPIQPKSFPKILPVSFLVLGLIAVFWLIFLRPSSQAPKPGSAKSQAQKISSKPKSSRAIESLLTKEEQAELLKPFQITVPRKLTDDEEEILKKQVSFPAALGEKPVLKAWSKSDFEKMLQAEQKKRKISLGWAYVRYLKKLFEENYLNALQTFQSGDYVLSREQFIKSLSFPVYRNDIRRHRAVVLVMLRPYINDALGKIALLNQYLLSQSLLTEVHALFGSYQALFPLLELSEWERALKLIEELKKQIAIFENRPQDAQVNYPQAFGALDIELQAAIRAEAAPKPEAAVSLKALSIDLGLKEKVTRSNTTEELLRIQRQFDEAISNLTERNWQAAREKLEPITYPPELAGEARKKLAFVDRILALEKEGTK